MKQTEAISIVHNALIGYVEDSAGAGSEEAKTLETTWDKLKETLPDEDRFPNGFTSWQETHLELVTLMTLDLHKWDGGKHNSNTIHIRETEGTGGIYELAKKWTDEFELTNVERQWDGEFYDEVEEFFNQKNKVE